MAAFDSLVDTLLEAPIVPSFTRVGYETRSRLEGWTPLDRYDLAGRVMVVTGGTSGLGTAQGHAEYEAFLAVHESHFCFSDIGRGMSVTPCRQRSNGRFTQATRWTSAG